MSHDPCYATLLCNVLVGASYCHWKDIIVRIVRIILKLSIEYMHNILEPTKSSSNGAVTGPWPGSFSGRIFLKQPNGTTTRPWRLQVRLHAWPRPGPPSLFPVPWNCPAP
jgi:hypothetical protein